MGWDFGYTSRDEIISEVTQLQATANGTYYECIARRSGGRNLWTVWENCSNRSERLIILYLIRHERSSPGAGWGYKMIWESEGPCEVNCPLSLLDMVPVTSGYSVEWREKVRAYHAKRAR